MDAPQEISLASKTFAWLGARRWSELKDYSYLTIKGESRYNLIAKGTNTGSPQIT